MRQSRCSTKVISLVLITVGGAGALGQFTPPPAASPAAGVLPADLVPPPGVARPVDPAAVASTTADSFSQLIKPLDMIHGNILDFEREGWFTINGVRLDKIEYNRQDAMIWTLQVNRPILCSHVLLFLDRLKDVRFYYRVAQTQLYRRQPPTFEVFRTVVNYTDRIKTGAANGEMLRQDDIFEIWIYLRPGDISQIIGRRANLVVFSEYGRLRRNKVWREYVRPAVDLSPKVPGDR